MKSLLFFLLVLLPILACGQKNAPCSIERLFNSCPILTDIGYTDAFMRKIYYDTPRAERKKYEINRNDVLCFFVKDTSELGVHYSHPAMDDPDVIQTGYIPYFFYALCRLKSTNGYYPIVYHAHQDERDSTFISIFTKEGLKQERFPIDYEDFDKSFTRSLVSPEDWSVLRVTYHLVAERDWEAGEDLVNTTIETELYLFDFTQKKFVRKYRDEKNSNMYYYRFAREDSYADDPFSKGNMEATKAKFKMLIEEFNGGN